MNQSEVTKSSPPFRGLCEYDVKKLFQDINTPAYVIDEAMLHKNGKILREIQERTGCKILLAQKAFSNYDVYGILGKYLAGTEASGLYEARLGAEEMPGGEVHVFCGAYREDEFLELLNYADHIVFNSPAQLKKFGGQAMQAGKSVGIRINPEHSTGGEHEIYDPCAKGSRLGTTKEQWEKYMTPELIALLDGIHFHTLCEQDSDALEETLTAVEEKFGTYLKQMKWVNFGGGHHITRPGYGIERLEKCIRQIQERYQVEVYLEPGEAIALNAGYLVTEILDVVENGETTNLIIDASAACHMPDVIEMPYLPPLYGTKEEGEGKEYRIGGPTCLAGDIVGDYCLGESLAPGDRLIFGDMAIYTMCKNNTFNGMPLPSIYLLKENGDIEELVCFQYEDFKRRLGTKG